PHPSPRLRRSCSARRSRRKAKPRQHILVKATKEAPDLDSPFPESAQGKLDGVERFGSDDGVVSPDPDHPVAVTVESQTLGRAHGRVEQPTVADTLACGQR